MSRSVNTAVQVSESRFAGNRSRQAGRRRPVALRSLDHLPSSVVLLAGLLAGFAVFQFFRSVQGTESADALARWSEACARLEETYGTEAAFRIETLRLQTVGKASGLSAAGEAPNPPVSGAVQGKRSAGSGPATALPGDPLRSQAFTTLPSSTAPAASAILHFLSDASPGDPVIERKPSPAQEAGTFPVEAELSSPDGMPSVSAQAVPDAEEEKTVDTASTLMNARTVPDEDARAFSDRLPTPSCGRHAGGRS